MGCEIRVVESRERLLVSYVSLAPVIKTRLTNEPQRPWTSAFVFEASCAGRLRQRQKKQRCRPSSSCIGPAPCQRCCVQLATCAGATHTLRREAQRSHDAAASPACTVVQPSRVPPRSRTMAAGDQTWDPQLEDKMVRWTGKWAEKEIDRAAQRLGGEKQFKKKKQVEKSKPREAGVYTHKGTAARIDAAAAPAPASAKRSLPAYTAAATAARAVVAPEDAVYSSDRRGSRPPRVGSAASSGHRERRSQRPPGKTRKPSAAPRHSNRGVNSTRRRRMGCECKRFCVQSPNC